MTSHSLHSVPHALQVKGLKRVCKLCDFCREQDRASHYGIRRNNGGVYKSAEFVELCANRGIARNITPQYNRSNFYG